MRGTQGCSSSAFVETGVIMGRPVLPLFVGDVTVGCGSAWSETGIYATRVPRHRSNAPTPMNKPPSDSSLSRRSFLHSSTLAATAAAATFATDSPMVRRAVGADSPEKIEVGFMGLNSRGMDLLKEFLSSQRVVVTWLCDVDQRAIDKAGAAVKAVQGLAFKTTPDVRRMLEDRRLQAVVIAAPDHWHVPAGLMALQAGKHLYVEKPLSHNPREGEWLVDAARKTRLVVQVGLQRRSVPWVIEAVGRIHAGELGPVHFARAWYAANRTSIGFGQLAPVPTWLDYSLWQGPAPEKPFRDNLVHYNWHWFWHWGTGELANNGVHFLDVVRWGMNLDCPQRVTSTGGRYFFDDDQETPDTQVVTFDFGGRTVVWEHRSCQPAPSEGEATGAAFYGRKATLIMGPSGYRVVDLSGKELGKGSGGTPSAPHVANFLDCIVNPGKSPAASAEDGHKSTLLCHLGNIAQRSGEILRVNPATRQLRGSSTASRFWSREYRRGWEPRV